MLCERRGRGFLSRGRTRAGSPEGKAESVQRLQTRGRVHLEQEAVGDVCPAGPAPSEILKRARWTVASLPPSTPASHAHGDPGDTAVPRLATQH